MASDEEKATSMGKIASCDETTASSVILKPDDRNNLKQSGGSGASPSPTTTNTDIANSNNIKKAKSCKGCLYYSSDMKADSRSPFCAGLTRSFPNLPEQYIGQSEMEASKEGRALLDFRYACVGYSLYADRKRENFNGQETQTELPVCMGLEVLVDRRVNTADSASFPETHIHNRDDSNGLPQRRSPRPTSSTGEEFLSRFARNANLVAKGVVKNGRRVGNQIKQSFDDMFYPYRRRPK